MNKSYGLILLLFWACPFTLSAQNTVNQNARFTLRIYQAEKEVPLKGQLYNLVDNSFEIHIENISEEDNIALFIFNTDEMFTAYDYPIETEKTEMFAPGTGLAMSVGENRLLSLYINKKSTQNYITSDRRINSPHKAVILVNEISTALNSLDSSGKAYMSFFIDYNQDRIIEENEISHIVLRFRSQKKDWIPRK